MKLALMLGSIALGACLDVPDDSTTEQALNGDTWVTTEHNTTVGSTYNDVAVDSTSVGTVFVLGTHQLTAGGSEWIMRTSTNDGTSFQLVGTYEGAAAKPAYGLKIAVDTNGAIYAGGMAVDAKGNNHWLLRRSTTGATGTYTNVFNVIDAEAGSMTNIVFDYSHGVWVGIANHVYYSPTGDAGTWTAILDYSGSLFITGLCPTTSGVVAVGSLNTQPPTWVTMVSADHATWSTLDQFTSPDAWAQSCVQNGNDIYVSGLTNFSTGEWATRHALAATPTSWTTVDSVAGPSSMWGPIKAMGTRGSQTYEVGQLCESGICHWHARRSPTAGGSGAWIDSDDFMDTTSSTSEATGFAYSHAYGSVFVVGAGGTGQDVRRL
jgi:hypothetical protein